MLTYWDGCQSDMLTYRYDCHSDILTYRDDCHSDMLTYWDGCHSDILTYRDGCHSDILTYRDGCQSDILTYRDGCHSTGGSAGDWFIWWYCCQLTGKSASGCRYEAITPFKGVGVRLTVQLTHAHTFWVDSESVNMTFLPTVMLWKGKVNY